MTKEEIFDIAKEAGFLSNLNADYIISSNFADDADLYEELKAFARLIVEKEREECARICEDLSNTKANMNKTWRNGCKSSADAIRARGQE
jgi:hypothetical protein